MHRSKNNSIKKTLLILIICVVILLLVLIFSLILAHSRQKKTVMLDNTKSENIIHTNNSEQTDSSKPISSKVESKTTETAEGIVISSEESSINMSETEISTETNLELPFIEKMAFVPDEFEKVQNYFGSLPEIKQNHTFEHTKIKAIYLSDVDYLDSYLEMVKGTEVNTFIIDAKESYGILYESQISLAKELNAIIEHRDLENIFERCHNQGIRVIARIVCFKDSTLESIRPDLTISTKNNVPIEYPLEGYQTFANPYDQRVWQYLIDIANEVIDLGADEIQFDYVRFPSGEPAEGTVPYFGEPDEVPQKYSAINRFLQTAVIEIQENKNTPVGADLFSIVMTSELDGKAIGQFWNFIGLSGIDNLCPMIYPSHYANASVGGILGNGEGSMIGNNLYEAPDLEPYNVVIDAFVDGMPAIQQEGYAHIRPYLQAFTADYLPDGYYKEYTSEEIHEQIQAVYDSGLEEWVLWNVQLEYPKGTFLAD